MQPETVSMEISKTSLIVNGRLAVKIILVNGSELIVMIIVLHLKASDVCRLFVGYMLTLNGPVKVIFERLQGFSEKEL